MAWSSDDQNPSMGPSAAYGGGNYAASLNAVTYPGGSSGTGMAPAMAMTVGGQPTYADRLNAAVPAQPKTTSQALAQFETRETNQPRATSTDRTNAARRYTKEVSTVRGDTARAQGDQAYDLLHPQFVQRFALAARQAQAEGIPIGIYSAYRPPNMGVGGFGDKYKSTHAYGIGADVSGIGRPGSDTSKRWNEIATEYGIVNPYGASHRKEWNHYQLVPEKSAYQIPGLRDTITGAGPIDPEQMWAASGVDPEGVPYTGGGTDRMVGNNAPPTPRMRPDRTEMAYAPAPEAQAPFDAVLDPSANRRPQPAAPRTRPQRDTLQGPTPTGGEYVVRRGDNLTKIARQAGVSVQEIVSANGIRNPDQINEGQRLVIPGGRAAPQQPAQVDMPTPRMRPERGANVPNPRPRPQQTQPAQDAGVPTPRMRPSQPQAQPQAQPAPQPQQRQGGIATEADVQASVADYRQRNIQNGLPEGPDLDAAVQRYERALRESAGLPQPDSGAADIGRAVSNFRSRALQAGAQPGPVLDEATRQFEHAYRSNAAQARPQAPLEPGMNSDGLIREPTAEERALQSNTRLPLPTGNQPMDPMVQQQIRRTPAVITDPLAQPQPRADMGSGDPRSNIARRAALEEPVNGPPDFSGWGNRPHKQDFMSYEGADNPNWRTGAAPSPFRTLPEMYYDGAYGGDKFFPATPEVQRNYQRYGFPSEASLGPPTFVAPNGARVFAAVG